MRPEPNTTVHQMAQRLTSRIESAETVKADEHVIVAGVGLIAACAALLALNASGVNSALLVLSTVLFAVSLSLTIWHRARFPRRMKLFEAEAAEIVTDSSDRIATFVESLVDPHPSLSAELRAVYHGPHGRRKVPDLDNASPAVQAVRDAIAAHMQLTMENMRRAERRAIAARLKEPAAAVKQVLDLIARRGRYPLFGLAIVTFVMSVLLPVAIAW